MLHRFPLGLNSFDKIREYNYLYVDKTQHAYNLIMQGHRYFLSRPRRFGKSLFVSTLKEILAGNKELFSGLWIEKSDYAWKKHGIIALDLSGIFEAGDFRSGICGLLQDVADNYGLELLLSEDKPDVALRALVRALYVKYGCVAVLVDEYDNPIVQFVDDPVKAKEMRNALRRFFAVVKSLDSYIDFVFITGVSSFARAGLFSGINNLRIITLESKFATICGYTDEEVDQYFGNRIRAWASEKDLPYEQIRSQLQYWYNGYCFGGGVQPVYNPYSLMNAIESQSFKNYWVVSGAPSFLIRELEKEYRKAEFNIFDVEKCKVTDESLGIFEIGATPLSSLMFQTGYLTIKSYDEESNSYELGYPNYEVKTASQRYLLSTYMSADPNDVDRFSLQLFLALKDKKFDEFVHVLKKMFVRVPYQLHIKEEKFYHALLQVVLGAAGLKVYSELPISHGRIDMVVELASVIYVIEAKLNAPAEKALEQIEARKYYEAFLYLKKPIVLLGLAFQRKEKTFEITHAQKILMPE